MARRRASLLRMGERAARFFTAAKSYRYFSIEPAGKAITK